MIKRISYVAIGVVALLALWGLSISRGVAQTPDPLSQESTQPEIVTSPDTAAPGAFPVQGRLTDTSGNPLDGTYTIVFSLYDVETGGTAICADSRSVTVIQGLFNSYVDHCYSRGVNGRKLWLGIRVGSNAEMTPRQLLLPVPYALALRPGAVISETLGSDAILQIENWATGGRALRVYGMSQSGVNYGIVGASRSPDGFGGYFYNNAAGVALWAESTNGNAIKAEGVNAASVLATNTNSPAVWATSINDAGVHGASGYAPGVEGFSINGPGVYGENLIGGVAIAAKGAITSTAPTYLWISGNDVVRYEQNNTTIINLVSNGGAELKSNDADPTHTKYVVLPITIAGTLYGQNVRVTDLDIYWQGETEFDALVDMRLRRQTGACWACNMEMIHIAAIYTCSETANPQGCTQHWDLSVNNVLSPDSGIIYLGLGFNFSGPSTKIRFGGARLTLEYDN